MHIFHRIFHITVEKPPEYRCFSGGSREKCKINVKSTKNARRHNAKFMPPAPPPWAPAGQKKTYPNEISRVAYPFRSGPATWPAKYS